MGLGNRVPLSTMLAVGLLTAAAQVVLLREYLAIFLGNELIVGVTLALWLAAGGLGSLIGVRRPARTTAVWTTLAGISIAGAIPLTRASRLLFEPGEAIPPGWIAAIIVATAAPCALLGGYLFGTLSTRCQDRGLYVAENAGNLTGSLLVYVAALLYMPNTLIIIVALAALVVRLFRSRIALLTLILVGTGLIALDRPSNQWKYAGEPSRIVHGREGELAWRTSQSDTSVFINNILYSTNLERPSIEQAVHIPMAQRTDPRRVLVLFDHGHSAELADYPNVRIDRVALEHHLAAPGARVIPPEHIHTDTAYDVILLGSGIPLTAAMSRFYAPPLLRHLRSLLGDSGVLSFTLPFNQHYMGDSERRLYDVILATTRAMFTDVWVFPGEGATFVASPAPLPRQTSPSVRTSYLAPFVVPSLTEDKLEKANQTVHRNVRLNTTARPVALSLALRTWAEQYRLSLWVFALLVGVLFCAGGLLLPRSGPVLSVGTSGFAAGLTSITYLLLYQASYGALYSRVSLLLMALTLGFVIGGYVGGRSVAQRKSARRLERLDAAIGLYAFLSVLVLLAVPYPPIALFLGVNTALGALCGLQFSLERAESEGVRYAADLLGGVLGMSLGSTVLMPLLGAWWAIAIVSLVKIAAWAVRAARAQPATTA